MRLPTTLQKKDDSYDNNEHCYNPYNIVNNLILLILLAKLIAPKKLAVLSLAFAVIVTIIPYRFVTLANQKIGTKTITTTRRFTC